MSLVMVFLAMIGMVALAMIGLCLVCVVLDFFEKRGGG